MPNNRTAAMIIAFVVIGMLLIVGLQIISIMLDEDRCESIRETTETRSRYYVANPATIDDRAYWEEPFTSADVYNATDPDYGSFAWDNRHVMRDIVAECQCPIASDPTDAKSHGAFCMQYLADSMYLGEIYVDTFNDVDGPFCQNPDPDFSDLGFGIDNFEIYFSYIDDCTFNTMFLTAEELADPDSCIVQDGMSTLDFDNYFVAATSLHMVDAAHSWHAVCEATAQRTQESYMVLLAVLFVIAAVTIFAVLKMMNRR